MRCIRSVFLGLVVLGISLPAAAQNVPKVEVSGGYNFLRVFDKDLKEIDEQNFPGGWYADVAGNVTSMLGIVGQVNGNYKTIQFEGAPGQRVDVDAKLHGFLGGVRLSSRVNSRLVPFGQILGGGVHSSFKGGGEDDSETDGALQVGGGVNLMPRGNIGVRLSADYLRVFAEDEGVNVFRFAAGIVLPFGMR